MIVKPETDQIIELIIQDLDKLSLIVSGSKGSGKSSSVKTILKRALEEKDIIVKVFDPSGSWYWKAPLDYRKTVTVKSILTDKIQNIGSIVYDVFKLNRETRLNAFATVVLMDFGERYNMMKRYGYDTVKSLPLILYVLEEADTYISSGVLRSKDLSSQIISDLVSIGRNYRMNVLGITTRTQEIDTKLRERSNLLIARQTGRNSLNAIRGATNLTVKKLSQKLPDYYFLYWNGKESQPFRIKDECTKTPVDYPEPLETLTKMREELNLRHPVIIHTPRPKRRINWIGWLIKLSILTYLAYSTYAFIYF